jgi:type II secretory pathway pseudopilin PulG
MIATSKRAGLSMIETLVVITIIMLLAALVAAVVVGSKGAANRTVDTSRLRNLSQAILLYCGDNDDLMPQAFVDNEDGTWATYNVYPIPSDWELGWPEAYYNKAESAWANAVFPYLNSYSVYRSTTGRDRWVENGHYIAGKSDYVRTSFQFNGLLTSYQSSAVARPSNLPLLTQARGEMVLVGYFSTSPRLVCVDSGPCRYRPSVPGCDWSNGGISHLLFSPDYSQWVYNKGQLVAYADGAAKWIPMSAPTFEPSDYRTMYWTRFSDTGVSITEWRDPLGCHSLLFRPDFDFEDFGTPIEEPSSKYAGYN